METVIYVVVRDHTVVGGPYPTRSLAEADCYKEEDIVEVLPSDEGYEELKSFMR